MQETHALPPTRDATTTSPLPDPQRPPHLHLAASLAPSSTTPTTQRPEKGPREQEHAPRALETAPKGPPLRERVLAFPLSLPVRPRQRKPGTALPRQTTALESTSRQSLPTYEGRPERSKSQQQGKRQGPERGALRRSHCQCKNTRETCRLEMESVSCGQHHQ